MFYTAGDFYSFTRTFGLADIRLSEVYFNCKNNILKSVGKREKFQTFLFLFLSGQIHTNSVKQWWELHNHCLSMVSTYT